MDEGRFVIFPSYDDFFIFSFSIFNRFAKKILMLRLLSLFTILSFFFAACKNDEAKKNETPQEAAAVKEKPRSNFTDEGTARVMRLLHDYYSLKDALVASDVGRASEAAITLQMSADSMEKFINDSTHILCIYVKEIKTQAGHIVTAKKNVELQRIPFQKVSDAVFTLLKECNLKNAGIYRQYCPMAFNNKGAYWLSREEKIKNPYFGNKMLTCGETTDTLK